MSIPQDVMADLATIGLSAEQARIVASMLSRVEDATREESEPSKEKARARWRKWREEHPTNVSKRLQPLANDSKRLVSGDAPVEDNLLTKVIDPQESKKDSSLRSEALSTQKRATRLKSDSVLLPEHRQVALDLGLPEHLIALEFEKMRDWSMSSRTGAKLDWDATWRNWCREAVGRIPRNRNGPPGAAKPDSMEAGFDRLREKRKTDERQARIADENVVLQLSSFSVR